MRERTDAELLRRHRLPSLPAPQAREMPEQGPPYRLGTGLEVALVIGVYVLCLPLLVFSALLGPEPARNRGRYHYARR